MFEPVVLSPGLVRVAFTSEIDGSGRKHCDFTMLRMEDGEELSERPSTFGTDKDQGFVCCVVSWTLGKGCVTSLATGIHATEWEIFVQTRITRL